MRLRAERLDTLGIEPEFFNLPRSVAGLDSVEYYLITDGNSEAIQFHDEWDIVAVGTSTGKPQEVEVRQLTIYHEFLEEPRDYNTWIQGMGLHAFSPAELVAFRELLMMLASRLPPTAPPVQQHSYFVAASAADYVACGIPQAMVDRFAAHFRAAYVYRYEPDVTNSTSDRCSFLQLSEWTTMHPLSSTVDVAFETYRADRVAEMKAQWDTFIQHQHTNPELDADMIHGESTLCFTRGGLLALAHLLQKRLDSFRRV